MVEKYYDDVWNQGNDCLDEIAAPGVVYADVFADVEDSFGRSALRGIIRDFQSGHPLLRYQLVGVGYWQGSFRRFLYHGCRNRHSTWLMHRWCFAHAVYAADYL